MYACRLDIVFLYCQIYLVRQLLYIALVFMQLFLIPQRRTAATRRHAAFLHLPAVAPHLGTGVEQAQGVHPSVFGHRLVCRYRGLVAFPRAGQLHVFCFAVRVNSLRAVHGY